MLKRLVALVIILGLLPSSVFAQSLRDSINAEAARLAQSQRPSSATPDNPYRTPAIVLVSVGGGLALLAFVEPTGISCSTTTTATQASTVSCGTSANKGLLFAGLGAVGVGAFLWMKGQKQNSPLPTIALLPRGVYVGKRFKF